MREEKRKPFRPEFHTDKIKLLLWPLSWCFVVCINFFIFEQIHTGVDRIDAVFSSNAAINDLSDTLNKLEGTVYEYLNIKGTKALENYYRYEQDYRELLDKLNDRNVDNEVKMLEKHPQNVRKLSGSDQRDCSGQARKKY